MTGSIKMENHFSISQIPAGAHLPIFPWMTGDIMWITGISRDLTVFRLIF